MSSDASLKRLPVAGASTQDGQGVQGCDLNAGLGFAAPAGVDCRSGRTARCLPKGGTDDFSV